MNQADNDLAKPRTPDPVPELEHIDIVGIPLPTWHGVGGSATKCFAVVFSFSTSGTSRAHWRAVVAGFVGVKREQCV